MIRKFVLITVVLAPSTAFAHFGHVESSGHGHGHWLAIALAAGAGLGALALGAHAIVSRMGRAAEEN